MLLSKYKDFAPETAPEKRVSQVGHHSSVAFGKWIKDDCGVWFPQFQGWVQTPHLWPRAAASSYPSVGTNAVIFCTYRDVKIGYEALLQHKVS